MEPRIDLVVLLQVGGPRLHWFRLAAGRRFETPDGPPSPGREVGDDVFDRPRTGSAGLVHAVLAYLREETLVRFVLGFELGQQVSSTHRRPPLISLRLTSSWSVVSREPSASASRPQPSLLPRSAREQSRSPLRARADRSRRSRPLEPRLARSDPPAPAVLRSPTRRSPARRAAAPVAASGSAPGRRRVGAASAPRTASPCRRPRR